MSTRVSRKSTVSSSSTTHTPQAGSSINHGRPTSPLSPTRISRIQEKEELQGLNDRLADYIDRVRQLELENNKLRREVHTIDEIKKSEVTNVKVMFEQELSELRKSLDELAGNNAKLEVDRLKLIEENQDLKSKLSSRSRPLTGHWRRDGVGSLAIYEGIWVKGLVYRLYSSAGKYQVENT
uniref:IF rod domain-containing protein n=1 Tax=Timema genevievae TaxID=629358 RepID=A0A7R9JU02_TIMGE|nr:unnamed protein product [Timema genevievae]